jgi:hypothetical protein
VKSGQTWRARLLKRRNWKILCTTQVWYEIVVLNICYSLLLFGVWYFLNNGVSNYWFVRFIILCVLQGKIEDLKKNDQPLWRNTIRPSFFFLEFLQFLEH